jgi:hypothetical protein
MRTAMMASQALDDASRWLMGQMPQMRAVMARHLVKRAAFGELLEAADLRHVKLGVGHLAVIVELDGDLGVAFDAGYRIDGDALHAAPSKSPTTEAEFWFFFSFFSGFSSLNFRRFGRAARGEQVARPNAFWMALGPPAADRPGHSGEIHLDEVVRRPRLLQQRGTPVGGNAAFCASAPST